MSDKKLGGEKGVIRKKKLLSLYFEHLSKLRERERERENLDEEREAENIDS